MKDLSDYEEEPMDIHQEETVEVISNADQSKTSLKSTSQRSYERNGVIHKETLIEKIHLACGHVNKPVGVVCTCGKTAFCDFCAEKLRKIYCSECFHFVFKCCMKGNDLDELYCLTCWKKLPFFKRLSITWG